MKKLLVLVLLLTSMAASGDDKDGKYMTVGPVRCGEFIEARRNKGVAEIRIIGWIGGYITAYNTRTPNTFDILGNSDLDSTVLWFENWCRANPLKQLSQGMEHLITELYPHRHKTANEAAR